MTPTACFYAPVPDPAMFHYNEFYNADRRILIDLGFDVTLEHSLRGLASSHDFYLVWWWTWALPWTLRCRAARRPCAITGTFSLYEPPEFGGYRHRPAWQRAVIAHAARTASVNVFVSQMEYEGVPREIPAAEPVLVPHGIDTQLYSPNGAKRAPSLLTIAWLNEPNAARKGVPESIRILERVRRSLPEATLTIVGDKGSGYPALRRLAGELGVADAVRFTGRAGPEEKLALLRAASVYLQPSVFEGFGVAVAEAMSCGLPVVTTGAGALPEVTGDAGTTCSREDLDGFTAAALALLTDAELWRRKSEAGRHRIVESFSYEKRRERIRTVCRSLGVL